MATYEQLKCDFYIALSSVPAEFFPAPYSGRGYSQSQETSRSSSQIHSSSPTWTAPLKQNINIEWSALVHKTSVLSHTISCISSAAVIYYVLTIHLVRFKLCDKIPVHLHHRLLGLFVLIQHQLGGDGTSHLGRLFHFYHLKEKNIFILNQCLCVCDTHYQTTII